MPSDGDTDEGIEVIRDLKKPLAKTEGQRCTRRKLQTNRKTAALT